MDEKTKSIVLMKYRPMIEEFREAIIEERKRCGRRSHRDDARLYRDKERLG